jgi:hypothetical protein
MLAGLLVTKLRLFRVGKLRKKNSALLFARHKESHVLAAMLRGE